MITDQADARRRTTNVRMICFGSSRMLVHLKDGRVFECSNVDLGYTGRSALLQNHEQSFNVKRDEIDRIEWENAAG